MSGERSPERPKFRQITRYEGADGSPGEVCKPATREGEDEQCEFTG